MEKKRSRPTGPENDENAEARESAADTAPGGNAVYDRREQSHRADMEDDAANGEGDEFRGNVPPGGDATPTGGAPAQSTNER